MFKEALIIFILFTILYFVLRRLLAKKPQYFRVTAISLLLLFTALNNFYNLRHLFPEFVLDGTTPLGDCRENLFLYKDDSEYSCQILFPILQNRTVLTDARSDFYDLFFRTFSGDTSSLNVTTLDAELVYEQSSRFAYQSVLHLVTMLDYAFPGNEALAENPLLFVHTDSLAGDDTLVAIVDEELNLYVMSASYYRQLTGTGTTEGGVDLR